MDADVIYNLNVTFKFDPNGKVDCDEYYNHIDMTNPVTGRQMNIALTEYDARIIAGIVVGIIKSKNQ